MVAAVTDFLGIGMYSPAEAAMYARIAPQLMRRWTHGTTHDKPLIDLQVPAAEEKTISFLDLVQTFAIRAIRETKKIPLQKIRQVIETANSMGIRYPFAHKHTTFLLGNDIQIDVADLGLVQASGANRRQLTIRPVVEAYLHDLTFDANGLANKYTAFESGGVKITMDPEVRFGEPLMPSGYTAWTLWEASRAEGSIPAAASVYGVDENEVLVAYRYIDSIRPTSRE